MIPTVLAVRRAEFQSLVRHVPFLALPREEIDRLHAAIEVLAVDEHALRGTTEWLALHSYVAVHHNYSWLTFRHQDAQRALLLSADLAAEAPVPLFLDDELVASAQRQVEKALGLNRGCEVRLAGILQTTDGEPPITSIGLVNVARLAARGTFEGADNYGNFELRRARSQFDRRSQVIIDHLDAL